MTRTWAIGLAALLGLVLSAGCGDGGADTGVGTPGGPSGASAEGSSAEGPKLLFITNGNSDWWNAVESGMKDAGKEFGCRVEMRRNNTQTQGQVEKLRDAMARSDVAGVAVSAFEADSSGILDAMRELRKAGKAVIAVDSDVAPDARDARDAYIGTNNVKAGEVAGRAARVLRPRGGKVEVFVGMASAVNARDRRDGFFQGAGETFVKGETWEDGNDPGRAASNVRSAISKTPDLGLLLGLWSYNAPMIAEEMRNNPEVRKKATVVTFDLDEAAVQDIADGLIDVSVCQNPYEMGYQGVKLLKALIAKDEKAVKEVLPDGKSLETGVRVIVPNADSPLMKPENKGKDEVITIDAMKKWLTSKGLKSS